MLDFDKPANQGFDPSLYMGVIENASPVYHFISTTTKRHFCTIKEQEKYDLLDHQSKAWKYQGIAFFAYPEGRQPPDARPVYRFWSQSLGHHFYTMDEATRTCSSRSTHSNGATTASPGMPQRPSRRVHRRSENPRPRRRTLSYVMSRRPRMAAQSSSGEAVLST